MWTNQVVTSILVSRLCTLHSIKCNALVHAVPTWLASPSIRMHGKRNEGYTSEKELRPSIHDCILLAAYVTGTRLRVLNVIIHHHLQLIWKCFKNSNFWALTSWHSSFKGHCTTHFVTTGKPGGGGGGGGGGSVPPGMLYPHMMPAQYPFIPAVS